MKKYCIVLMVLLLVGCSRKSIDQSVPVDKFEQTHEIDSFNIQVYINQIDPIINDLAYVRLDSIFYDDESTRKVIVTDRIVENVIQIYNEYSDISDTYALINFLDLHVKELSELEVDILIFKLISRIEEDYIEHLDIVNERQFNYMIIDFITRITDTFIDNYSVTPEILNDYPDMYRYLERVDRIVNGGYQIRRYEDQYYMFTDYASFLVRYKEYFSEETGDAVDILVRESRNIVKINDVIQVDNEAIAYKTDEIESYMKAYPNSVYYSMMRALYVEYLQIIVSNPDNIEEVAANTLHYKADTVDDLKVIIDRYSNSQMARIIEELVEIIESDKLVYEEDKIIELMNKISTTY